MIECQHGDVGVRRRHRGTRVGAPECQLGVGVEALGRWLGIRVCLDQTFQDAGGWLMKVVDEDPIQRWNPPGSQFCEKISGIVVLSWDMM